jgi:hypothetical protein
MPSLDRQEQMNDLDRQMHEHAKNGNWDKAIQTAHSIYPNWSPFEKLPQYKIPEEHADKILDILSNKFSPHHSTLPSFLYEHAQSLQPDVSARHLNRLADMAKEDMLTSRIIHEHPNYSPDEETKGRLTAANFWGDYEQSVKASHFAAVGSLYSGKPEFLRDHRDQAGSSEEYQSAIPHLHKHAAAAQDAIMHDPDIRKRWFNNEPHIKLYRGVGGTYGKMIRDKANYNVNTNEIDHRRFRLPTASFSSWSTKSDLPSRFAHARDDITNQPKKQGVVISRWIPLKDVLHSGNHIVVSGQVRHHPDEEEIVVGHPKGHIDVSTKEMQFVHPQYEYGQTKAAKIRPLSMKKGLKEMALAGAMIMMPTTIANVPGQAPQAQQQKAPSPFAPKGQHPMDSFLEGIAHLESSGGINTAHRPSKGFHQGATAIGPHAIMPMTAQYVAKKSKSPHIKPLAQMSPHDVSDVLGKNPDLQHEVAREYAGLLHTRFKGDTQKMAYAWRHGPNAEIASEDLHEDSYVNTFSQVYKPPKPVFEDVQSKLKKLKGMIKP